MGAAKALNFKKLPALATAIVLPVLTQPGDLQQRVFQPQNFSRIYLRQFLSSGSYRASSIEVFLFRSAWATVANCISNSCRRLCCQFLLRSLKSSSKHSFGGRAHSDARLNPIFTFAKICQLALQRVKANGMRQGEQEKKRSHCNLGQTNIIIFT